MNILSSIFTRPLIVMFFILILSSCGSGSPGTESELNHSPDAPIMISPGDQTEQINFSDVHMESQDMVDSNLEDVHMASDWEIWLLDVDTRVWNYSQDVTDLVHTHLSEGEFEGPQLGDSQLEGNTWYRLRVRYQDSSGASNSVGAWSAWTNFKTATRKATVPMLIGPLSIEEEPSWRLDDGTLINIEENAVISMLSAGNELLFEINADVVLNQVATTPFDEQDIIDDIHHEVKLVIESQVDWTIPPSYVEFKSYESDETRTIWLPELQLSAGVSEIFWITNYGETFRGSST
jgi:hypothetical protein